MLEALDGDDWQQPTYCATWTVRDMVAHLAGAWAGWSSWAEFRRQVIQNPYLNETGQQVDGINKRQILDRAERTPAELVAEFRDLASESADDLEFIQEVYDNIDEYVPKEYHRDCICETYSRIGMGKGSNLGLRDLEIERTEFKLTPKRIVKSVKKEALKWNGYQYESSEKAGY